MSVQRALSDRLHGFEEGARWLALFGEGNVNLEMRFRAAQGQALEAKANLLRLRQEIPLTDEELAAVNEGIRAYEHLLKKLADVATPAGPTPRELSQLVQLKD